MQERVMAQMKTFFLFINFIFDLHFNVFVYISYVEAWYLYVTFYLTEVFYCFCYELNQIGIIKTLPQFKHLTNVIKWLTFGLN